MIIMIVSNCLKQMNQLDDCLRSIFPEAEIRIFRDATEAMKYVSANKVSLVFSSAKMRYMDGVKLAEGVRHFCRTAKVYLVLEIGQEKAVKRSDDIQGFLMSPVSVEAIEEIRI